MHSARLAASRTDWTAGKSIAIKMAMIAITTNNSTNVNAIRERLSKVTTGWFMIQLSEGDSSTIRHYGLKVGLCKIRSLAALGYFGTMFVGIPAKFDSPFTSFNSRSMKFNYNGSFRQLSGVGTCEVFTRFVGC